MAVYTHGHAEPVLRSHQWRTAENSAAYLLPHLVAGQDLLDVGCGPGTITADLARLVSPGRVLGLDQAPAVLEQAAAVARARGLDTVDFATGDALDLHLPEASFDVVHAHQMLQHVGDPVAALREMRRVCRPGGIVAARDADYAAFAWYPEEPLMEEWRDLYRAVAVRNGGEPDAGRRLLRWGRGAGFAEVTASASVWCFATPEHRAWWGGVWRDRVLNSDVAELVVESGLSTRERLQEISQAWQRWSEAEDGWFLVPHGEILCRV